MDPTILVVEDDPQLRDVITDVLSDEGYDVYQAQDGVRALERIDTVAPDLVLSDISMPRLSGVELAKRLTQRPDPVPIILMSAAVNAPSNGRAQFLAKPFTIDELIALVGKMLGESARAGDGPGRPRQHVSGVSGS